MTKKGIEKRIESMKLRMRRKMVDRSASWMRMERLDEEIRVLNVQIIKLMGVIGQ